MQSLAVLVAVLGAVGLASAQQCTINQVYGCYIDTVTPRTLPSQASNAYSQEECAQNCYNLGYTGTAGSENGEECWCSTATGPVGQSASSDDCNKFCPDDTSEMCGGLSRLTEYSFDCSGGATYYSCNQNDQCVQDPNGAYTDPNCNGQCSGPSPGPPSPPGPSPSPSPPSPPSPGKGGSSALSAGDILLIIFFCGLLIPYFVFGAIYMRFGRQQEGLDVIPNRSFWFMLPGLVVDGFRFILDKVRGTNSTYESL